MYFGPVTLWTRVSCTLVQLAWECKLYFIIFNHLSIMRLHNKRWYFIFAPGFYWYILTLAVNTFLYWQNCANFVQTPSKGKDLQCTVKHLLMGSNLHEKKLTEWQNFLCLTYKIHREIWISILFAYMYVVNRIIVKHTVANTDKPVYHPNIAVSPLTPYRPGGNVQ